MTSESRHCSFREQFFGQAISGTATFTARIGLSFLDFGHGRAEGLVVFYLTDRQLICKTIWWRSGKRRQAALKVRNWTRIRCDDV